MPQFQRSAMANETAPGYRIGIRGKNGSASTPAVPHHIVEKSLHAHFFVIDSKLMIVLLSVLRNKGISKCSIKH